MIHKVVYNILIICLHTKVNEQVYKFKTNRLKNILSQRNKQFSEKSETTKTSEISYCFKIIPSESDFHHCQRYFEHYLE